MPKAAVVHCATAAISSFVTFMSALLSLSSIGVHPF
jgi:hypothetical protein